MILLEVYLLKPGSPYSSGVYSWSPAALNAPLSLSCLSLCLSVVTCIQVELRGISHTTARPQRSAHKNIFPLICQKTFLEENKERGNGWRHQLGVQGASPPGIHLPWQLQKPGRSCFHCPVSCLSLSRLSLHTSGTKPAIGLIWVSRFFLICLWFLVMVEFIYCGFL